MELIGPTFAHCLRNCTYRPSTLHLGKQSRPYIAYHWYNAFCLPSPKLFGHWRFGLWATVWSFGVITGLLQAILEFSWALANHSPLSGLVSRGTAATSIDWGYQVQETASLVGPLPGWEWAASYFGWSMFLRLLPIWRAFTGFFPAPGAMGWFASQESLACGLQPKGNQQSQEEVQ